MSDVSLKGLTKHFAELTAVDSVDLEVAAGEVLCLLGPSGCGKTTILRMVAGLEFASSGDIHLGGKRVNELAARDRDVAMVFQFYALYPGLSVADNLAFPLRAEGLRGAEISERVDRIASALALGEFLDRRADQLAEGEKQRVAVGRAIVRDPTCFLFDEPLSRLDVQLRETMRGQIKEVLTGLNRATVIVTHDQLEALTMADRIAVMRSGRLEQVGTPHEVFTQPANLFVAGFIGTPQMNLLPAQAVGNGSFDLGEQRLDVGAAGAVANLPMGSAATIGIRPRNLEVVANAGADTLSATVDVVEPMGAETLVHLLDGEREVRVVVDRGVRVSYGDQLHVRLPGEHVHVFGPDEQRINGGLA